MTAEEYFKQHGFSKEILRKFGITEIPGKIVFPIKDEDGIVMFNKYRHLDFDKEKKDSIKFNYDPGSHTSLFNSEVLKDSNYVFILEGEPDVVKATQEGIVAVSNTSGASTFKDEWVELFRGKRTYILYDNDVAGVTGAAKVKEKIPHALIVTLPTQYKDLCEYFQEHTVDEFKKLFTDQTKKDIVTYQQLCDTIDKWLLLPDKNVIKVLLASLVAHFFETDPLWMFLVAPSSGTKTELISTISTLPFVYLLSDLTPQTLASGMPAKKDKDPSLLLKLKDNVIAMKDFTTVLSMRFEDRQQIMAQFREIYDGSYRKDFGTGKRIEWEGRITLIAGVTTIIDTHSSVFQVMGERFIMYRIPQANDALIAQKALSNYGNEKKMREELRTTVQAYFKSLSIPKASSITLPQEILVALSYLASFIVKARSGLIRDNYKKELTYIPETESPARVAKQLGTLMKAFTVLDERNVVSWQDFYLTMRVGFDVISNNRMSHILALCQKEYPSNTTEIAQKTDYSRSGSEIILEDLTALKIVQVNRRGSGQSNEWQLSLKTYEYFNQMLPKDPKGLEVIFPEGDKYTPLIQEILHGKAIPMEVKATDKVMDQIDRDLGIF